MRFYWQNLNDKPMGRQGSPWKAMRFWLGKFGVEWVFGLTGFHFSFSIGGNHTWRVGFCPIIFSLWISWNGRYAGEGREAKIYWSDNALWIIVWSDPMCWSLKDPWWKKGLVIHFVDILFGKVEYSNEILMTVETVIPMPEGSYPATVAMEFSQWKRPRWFTKSLYRADVKVENGIPFEGKGENSWDCGEDALYGLSCTATTIEEAVAKTVQSVLRDRRKYGTPDRIKTQFAPEVNLLKR